MTFKRLLMPMLLWGVILVMGSMTYVQAATAINCGLSAPLNSGAGSTPRATATGHTDPVAAGPPFLIAVGPPVWKAAPPTDGGGALRVTCINNTGATVGTPTDPGVVVLTIN